MKRLFQLQNQALDTFKQGLVTYVTWFFFLAMISTFIASHVQSLNGFVKLVMGMTLGVIVWIAALRVGANYHHNAIYATGVFCDGWENYPTPLEWATKAIKNPTKWDYANGKFEE